jgi:alpha-amylase
MSLREPEQVAPFYFCVDIGDYTGISAASYKDFLTSIKQVKAKSLSFHVERGDFQKWVLDVLKDKKLAKEIGKIKNQKLRGQALRKRLYHIVSKRHKELASKKH